MLLGIDPCGHIAAFESRPDNAAHSMDTDWYAVDRDGKPTAAHTYWKGFKRATAVGLVLEHAGPAR